MTKYKKLYETTKEVFKAKNKSTSPTGQYFIDKCMPIIVKFLDEIEQNTRETSKKIDIVEAIDIKKLNTTINTLDEVSTRSYENYVFKPYLKSVLEHNEMSDKEKIKELSKQC